MNGFFRDYGWMLRFAVAGVAAVLIALILNRWLASELAPYTVVETPTFAETSVQTKNRRGGDGSDERPKQWASRLEELCLFGCPDEKSAEKKSCPGGCPDGQTCKKGTCKPVEKKKNGKPGVPEKSDLKIKVMGCMVADDSDHSRALIQDESSKKTYIVRVGDELPGGATIVSIERNRIFVKNDGRIEYIPLQNTIAGSPTSAAATGQGTTPSRSVDPASLRQTAEELTGGTEPLNAEAGGSNESSASQTKTVPEGAVEKALENPEKLARSANFVPKFDPKSGDKKGLKVVGVAPSSVLSKMGVESGDVIRSVDGETLDSKKDALEILEKLREKKSANVEIQRDGESVERQFRVGD
ncbi:MAG: type II secretion system protein GspC [Bradymonadaceae bacterium]